MKIMRPKNPFFFFALFFPWRFINTYIVFEDNKITLSRYYAINGTQFRREIDEIILEDIQGIGFPSDLKVKRQESVQTGARGVYSPQEIDFKTRSGIIALNAKPYTKKQLRYLIESIGNKSKNVLIGKGVAKFYLKIKGCTK